MNTIKLSFWQFGVMRYVIYTLVTLVPIWYGSGHLFPYTTAKSLLIIFGGILVAALFLWGTAREYENKLSVHWMHGLVGLLVVSMTLSALLGVDTQFSFFGSLIDGTGLNVIFAAMVISFGIAFWVKYKSDFLEKLAWVSIGSSVIVALGTYFQTAFPTTSGGSTFGNTSYMAAYFLINICLAIGLITTNPERWKKILAGIPLVLMIFSPSFFNRHILIGETSLSEAFRNPLLFAGVSNGATIALATMIPIMIGLFLLIQGNKQWKKVSGGILLGIVTIGMLGFWTLFQNPGNPIYEFFVERKTTNRLLFWDIAKEGIADRPMFGWGMNNYAYVFQEKFKTEFFSKDNVVELWTNNPHNMFLEVGVNQGIIGLVLYIGIIISAIWMMMKRALHDKKYAPWMITMTTALIGYNIQNLFIFDTPGTILFFWLIIGIAIGSANWKEYRFSNKYQYIIQSLMKVVAIMIVLLLPMVFFKPWKESKEWVKYSQVQVIATRTESPQGISRLGYASDTSYIAGRFIDILRSEFGQGVTDEKDALLVQVLNRLQLILSQELQTGKENFRAHWTIGQVYALLAFTADKENDELIALARTHFERAHEMNPANIYLILEQVKLDVFENKIADAEQKILQVLAITPHQEVIYRIADSISSKASKSFLETIQKAKQEHAIVME